MATHSHISTWDVSAVTDLSYLVYIPPCWSTFDEDINAWNVGQVTSMRYMFQNSAFDQPIESWNVGQVSSTYYMFGYSGGLMRGFNKRVVHATFEAQVPSVWTYEWSDANDSPPATPPPPLPPPSPPSLPPSPPLAPGYFATCPNSWFGNPICRADGVPEWGYCICGNATQVGDNGCCNVGCGSCFDMGLKISPPPPPLPATPPGIQQDKEALQDALIEWCIDPASATNRIGPIATWDVSTVSDMSELLRYIPCGYEFNEDIDAWDVGQVTTMDVRRRRPPGSRAAAPAHRPPHQASGC